VDFSALGEKMPNTSKATSLTKASFVCFIFAPLKFFGGAAI
jgi:hypothetical protein